MPSPYESDFFSRVTPDYTISDEFSVPNDSDSYEPYSFTRSTPDYTITDEFSVPDFSADSYATYQPRTSSRADDFESKLQQMMGKFDGNGNFGINDTDRATAKDAKWVELGKRLSKAGFSHSYAGYGDAMEGIGGAMGGAEEASLKGQSTENLRTELQKLDMEDKLSQAEKNRLALRIAQDDYDSKEKSRRMGAEVYAQEMTPEKINMLVSSIKIPSDQTHARMAFARMKLYMEAGDLDKAAEVSKEIDQLIPEVVQDRVDRLFAAREAESKAEVVGKGQGQIETAKNLPPGMEMGSGGNVQSIDPLDAAVKRSNIAQNNASAAGIRAGIDLNKAKLEKESKAEIEAHAREEGEVAKAIDAIVNLKARGLDLGEGNVLIWSKTKQPVSDAELMSGPKAELLQMLQKQAMLASGVLSRFPQLPMYGPPTQDSIRRMLEDLRSGRTSPLNAASMAGSGHKR